VGKGLSKLSFVAGIGYKFAESSSYSYTNLSIYATLLSFYLSIYAFTKLNERYNLDICHKSI